MFSERPVIVLVKEPNPLPSVVWLFSTVGVEVVAQQTPLAVIEVPPSVNTTPPDVALVVVIEVILLVVTLGAGFCISVTVAVNPVIDRVIVAVLEDTVVFLT